MPSQNNVSNPQPTAGDLTNLFGSAQQSGVISPNTSTLLSGDIGSIVIAGAAGQDVEDIVASDVTLVTLLVDESSSIGFSQLEVGVRDGYNMLLDALQGSKEAESVLLALWTFNGQQSVVHSYVPIGDATRLDGNNYRPSGSTCLYETWCDALAANVAYAQQLRDNGTPTRSIVVVITDGEDTSSRRRAADCNQVSQDLLKSEQFILAFVGVGEEADFRRIAQQMGVPDGCVHVQASATNSGIRQVFDMVSKSAIRASQGQIQPGTSAGFFTP